MSLMNSAPTIHATKSSSSMSTATNTVPQLDPLCWHLLKLHFPATALLPPGKLPYTQPPVDMGYREKPVLGTYHLTSSNVDYFTRFPTEPVEAVHSPPTNVTDVSCCVSRLAEAPGVSNLLAVSFIGDDDILTRLCLKTTWITSQGSTQEEERHFEVCSMEWQLRLGLAESDSTAAWTFLMNDLMTGSSDRAVLHRLQKMETYDKTWAYQEQSSWQPGWEELSFPTPNQRVANNIEYVFDETGVGLEYAPTIFLQAYDDDDVIEAQLPCGRHFTFVARALKQLTEDECTSARCEIEGCRKRIMTREDDHLLAVIAERRHRDWWFFEQIDWERLDHEINSNRTIAKLPGVKLYQSLKLALNSMRAPDSTTPTSLDPTQYPEMAVVCAHLGSLLESEAVTIEMSAEDIFKELGHQTMNAIKAASVLKDESILALVLPPGFNKFLCRWLTRTVNHVIGIRSHSEGTAADTGSKWLQGTCATFGWLKARAQLKRQYYVVDSQMENADIRINRLGTVQTDDFMFTFS